MPLSKPIDFSCKHDVLIHYKDGSLLPMDEPHYDAKEIAENTWQIMSSGDYHYLVVGDEEGVSIDTGYGAGDLRKYLEELCGKPVRSVINTHYHFDHTANNSYFDKVYISAEDAPKATIAYPSFEGIDFPRDYEEVIVDDGSIVPLKGRELEIFKIGDHTPGGIAILDRKGRILFTGDELMAGGKMMRDAGKFASDMAKIHAHRSEYDRICAGGDMFDAEMVDIFYEASVKIMAGERSPEPERQPMRRPDIPVIPGVKVYDCQHPHQEDTPQGRPGNKKGPGGPPPAGTKMGCLVYRGMKFMFPDK